MADCGVLMAACLHGKTIHFVVPTLTSIKQLPTATLVMFLGVSVAFFKSQNYDLYNFCVASAATIASRLDARPTGINA